jgi:regulatory protein
MAVKSGKPRKPRPPLNAETLERSALHYAERYATTRAKLASYLTRKLRERGWDGGEDPPVERLVERMAELGYVNDRAFAEARAGSLGRRGYGERRVNEALRAAGVGEEDAAGARETAREQAWAAALRFAERRRIGPFAAQQADRPAREKAIAAMLRAGHPVSIARVLAQAGPGEIPDADVC